MSKITHAQLATFAVNELDRGVSMKLVARKIAGYLLDTRQSRDTAKVMRAIEAEMNKRGRMQVTITSAHAVTDTVKTELANMLGAKNPVFHEEIDPRVIGGVKAQVGESEIDLTVRGKLQRFTTTLVTE